MSNSKVSKINPKSRLLAHTQSSLNRQLRTMEAHPDAFKSRSDSSESLSQEVSSRTAQQTAVRMRQQLQNSNINSNEKRQAMTYAFSEPDSIPDNSRTFQVIPEPGKPGEAALSRMMLSAPKDLVPIDNTQPAPSEKQRDNWAWRDASVSNVRGQHQKNADRVEVEAVAAGKTHVGLAAFNSADHHAKSGFQRVNLSQPEDTGDEVIQNPVMIKKLEPVRTGRIPKPFKPE